MLQYARILLPGTSAPQQLNCQDSTCSSKLEWLYSSSIYPHATTETVAIGNSCPWFSDSGFLCIREALRVWGKLKAWLKWMREKRDSAVGENHWIRCPHRSLDWPGTQPNPLTPSLPHLARTTGAPLKRQWFRGCWLTVWCCVRWYKCSFWAMKEKTKLTTHTMLSFYTQEICCPSIIGSSGDMSKAEI